MNSPTPSRDEPRDEDIPLTPQPARQWYRAHLAELRQKYGKGTRVAIDPARGVIASGSLAEVQAQLDAMGEPRDPSDVVISVVR